MSVDLSGLKVGSVWRVETSWMNGTLFVYNIGDTTKYVVYYNGGGADGCDATGLTSGGIYRITRILHELKPVSDINVKDLDRVVIETSDGGCVTFCDGIAFTIDSNCLVTTSSPTGAFPSWLSEDGDSSPTPREEADVIIAAYDADVARRNEPLEFKWNIAIDHKGYPAHSSCMIRGDFWQMWHRVNGSSPIGMYLNRQWVTDANGFGDAEQYIRDHYATKECK